MGRSCCEQKAPPSPPNHASTEARENRISCQDPSQSTENLTVAPDESGTNGINVDIVDTRAGGYCQQSEESQGDFEISCEDQCCETNIVRSGTQRNDSGPSNEIDTQSCAKGVSSCCDEGPVISASHKAEESPSHAETMTDACCGPKPPKQRISAGSNQPDVTDCCRGKDSPCCDEACLDRLALRACKGEQTVLCTDPTGRCVLPWIDP